MSMALDPSIILQAGQGQQIASPFQMANQAAQLQNALIQNRSGLQQLRARQAIGPLYQQSIDPKTGDLDTNKLLSLASQNPDTAWMAGDLVKSAQDRQTSQLAIQKQQLDLAQQHVKTLQGSLAPLIANPNATSNDVVSSMTDLVQQGLVQPQEAAQELSTMPSDPGQLKSWMIQHYTRLQGVADQISNLYGAPQQTNTGNAIQQGTESALTGYHPQGSFQLGLSPSDAASPVQTIGPNNQPGVISKGTFAAQQHIGGDGAYIPTNGQPMSSAPAQGSPTAQATPPSTSASPQGGFMPTGAVPGTVEAQQFAAEDNAKQGQAALSAANDARQNVLPLIKEAKANLNTVSSGPAAPFWKSVGQLASQFGVNFNPQGTANQEVAEKVLEQLAERQSQALSSGGANSDAKLASAKNATPNIHMSPLGLQGALATVEGNQNAITLRGQAYQTFLSHNGNPADYNKFATAFNKDIDPFVLQVRALPPQQEQQLLNSMKPAERKAFNASAAKVDQFIKAVGWQP